MWGWINRKAAWVRRRPLVWANVTLGAVTLGIVSCPGPLFGFGPADLRLRVWALILQLLGAFIVWLDLTSAAREHGHEGIWKGFVSYVREGLLGRDLTLSVNSIVVPTEMGRVRAKVRETLDATQPLERRVETLETLFTRLDNEMDATYREIDSRVGELKENIEAESKARTAAVGNIEKQIKNAATLNYPILAFGAFWVAIGTILAAIAPELAKLLADPVVVGDDLSLKLSTSLAQ